MSAQCGAQVAVLGRNRLEIIEWLQALVQLDDESISRRMGELKVPELLLAMLSTYWANTFLHKTVFAIFSAAVKSKLPSSVQIVLSLRT